MPNLLVRAINTCGRFLEFVLTGQSEYALTTSDFRTADSITDTVQARLAYREVSSYLQRKLGIVLQHPVIVILDKPQIRGWKRAIAGAGSHLGNHRVRQFGEKISHEVRLVPGMERRKFMSVLAHELTHAYQAERQMLSAHRGLKEGMARWVEYHILCDMKMEREARKLRSYRSFILGRHLVAILDYESHHGLAATLSWLESLG